jgi:adenylosuccinate synthase
LVDPSLVDLKSLGDEVRFRIFDYLWSKGVGSSELGIDPTYANKIKNRKARVSDALLERMLRMLSVDDLLRYTILLRIHIKITGSRGCSQVLR